MNVEKMSDASIAFLTYAVEHQVDRLRHNPNATKAIVKAGQVFETILHKEYTRRNLDWTMFMPEN